MEFGFELIRLWEIPAEVIKQLAQRLEQDAEEQDTERLLTAAYVLTGLRLRSPDDVRQLTKLGWQTKVGAIP